MCELTQMCSWKFIWADSRWWANECGMPPVLAACTIPKPYHTIPNQTYSNTKPIPKSHHTIPIQYQNHTIPYQTNTKTTPYHTKPIAIPKHPTPHPVLAARAKLVIAWVAPGVLAAHTTITHLGRALVFATNLVSPAFDAQLHIHHLHRDHQRCSIVQLVIPPPRTPIGPFSQRLV